MAPCLAQVPVPVPVPVPVQAPFEEEGEVLSEAGNGVPKCLFRLDRGGQKTLAAAALARAVQHLNLLSHRKSASVSDIQEANYTPTGSGTRLPLAFVMAASRAEPPAAIFACLRSRRRRACC